MMNMLAHLGAPNSVHVSFWLLVEAKKMSGSLARQD